MRTFTPRLGGLIQASDQWRPPSSSSQPLNSSRTPTRYAKFQRVGLEVVELRSVIGAKAEIQPGPFAVQHCPAPHGRKPPVGDGGTSGRRGRRRALRRGEAEGTGFPATIAPSSSAMGRTSPSVHPRVLKLLLNLVPTPIALRWDPM